tara:strand:- start:353 stop:598 length:246 start_codon:yes stop_codon:yes gene_type:complete
MMCQVIQPPPPPPPQQQQPQPSLPPRPPPPPSRLAWMPTKTRLPNHVAPPPTPLVVRGDNVPVDKFDFTMQSLAQADPVSC